MCCYTTHHFSVLCHDVSGYDILTWHSFYGRKSRLPCFSNGMIPVKMMFHNAAATEQNRCCRLFCGTVSDGTDYLLSQVYTDCNFDEFPLQFSTFDVVIWNLLCDNPMESMPTSILRILDCSTNNSRILSRMLCDSLAAASVWWCSVEFWTIPRTLPHQKLLVGNQQTYGNSCTHTDAVQTRSGAANRVRMIGLPV